MVKKIVGSSLKKNQSPKNLSEDMSQKEDLLNNAVLNEVFKKSPLAMCILDHNLKYLKVNKSLMKILVSNKKEYLGKAILEMPSAIKTEAKNKIDLMLKNKSGIKEKAIEISNDAKKRYWVITHFPIRVKGKKMFILIGTEITDLKEKEQKIKNETSKLEEENKEILESKNRYEALFQSIEQGIFVIDKNGSVITANKKTEKILDQKVKDLIKKDFHEVFKITDDEGNIIPRKETPNLTVLKTGKSLQGKYWITTKNRKRIPISLTTSPLLDGKKIIGVVSVVRDITTELKNEQKKSEIVSIAAHQLRTPLAIFDWYNQRLLNEELGALTEKQKEYLMKIQNTIKSMVELVEVFLNVSKIELGTFIFNSRPVDAISIAQNVLNDAQPQLTKKKLKLVKQFIQEPLIVNTDISLIKMTLQNLLSNAIKYTGEGGTIALNLYCSQQKNPQRLLKIQVADTGIGIPQKQQSKIFQKLFRAENAKTMDPGGVGLGLYALKSIVEKVGGKIWFETGLKRKKKNHYQTIFHVEIPLKKSQNTF